MSWSIGSSNRASPHVFHLALRLCFRLFSGVLLANFAVAVLRAPILGLRVSVTQIVPVLETLRHCVSDGDSHHLPGGVGPHHGPFLRCGALLASGDQRGRHRRKYEKFHDTLPYENFRAALLFFRTIAMNDRWGNQYLKYWYAAS
jgi:hypothetical protein